MAPHVLVADDDAWILRMVATVLEKRGYTVETAADGEEALRRALARAPDLLITDVMMPRMDGWALVRQLRAHAQLAMLPVVFLTALTSEDDRIRGFRLGADDYVAKPFHLEEVLARIRALLRRSAGHAKSELNCGAVRLDTRTGRVTVDGNPVKLTSHEYRLLSYLMHHTGRVVSRSELVEHLYDQDFDRDSNTIEVFVGRIRKKLGVEVIQTVRGLGYLLTPPGNAP